MITIESIAEHDYSPRYDGSCRKKAESSGTAVTEDNRGHVAPTGFMDTCRDGVRI